MDVHGELCKCSTMLPAWIYLLPSFRQIWFVSRTTPWIVQFKKIKFALSLPHEVHFSPCFQGTVAKRAVRNLGDMVGEEVAMTVQVWQLQLGQVGWVGH